MHSFSLVLCSGKEHKRPLGVPTAVIGWTSNSMTQQLCAQRCANESMKLAGVEFADQCYWCAATSDRHDMFVATSPR